jgi:2-isopropylmalate synthase
LTIYENDIRRAGEAIKPAKSGRIHTFIATSPIHMEKKLRMTPDEVVEQAVKAVRWAREYTDDVEFSAEDAGRSELDFLCRIFEAVIQAGAKTLNVPDTVGYNVPGQYASTIRSLRERVPNSDKVVWSVHCHNDLGTGRGQLAGRRHGGRAPGRVHHQRPGRARRQRCAGRDRHGRATRQDIFGCETRIDRSRSCRLALVSGITGFPVQPNKAIVGANAFAHESGIHQDGVLKHRETYEIMRAQDVGWTHQQAGAGQAFRPQRLPCPAGRAGHRGGQRGAAERSPSAASRNWPTRSTRSSTRTCRR